MSEHIKYLDFPGRIVFVGFGSIGQGTLPLVLRHLGIPPSRITIVTGDERGKAEAEKIGVDIIDFVQLTVFFETNTKQWTAIFVGQDLRAVRTAMRL